MGRKGDSSPPDSEGTSHYAKVDYTNQNEWDAANSVGCDINYI